MGSREVQVDLDQAKEWRDGHGKRLADYPRPSLAVDVAVLTLLPGAPRPVTTRSGEPYERGALAVVVHRRPPDPGAGVGNAAAAGSWALPGTFLHEDERLAGAARRALRDKCDIKKAKPRQLRAFDQPRRDPRGWVVSVAHWAVVPYARVARVLSERDDVVARPVAAPGAFDDLAFDHRTIVNLAVRKLRRAYTREPDPDGLLGPEPFTLLHLRLLHEAVLGETLQKDTFRRRMEPHLIAEGGILTGAVGRPAQLYRRRTET